MEQPELVVMTPLIHFLQLLCENHNNFLQVRLEYTHAVILWDHNYYYILEPLTACMCFC